MVQLSNRTVAQNISEIAQNLGSQVITVLPFLIIFVIVGGKLPYFVCAKFLTWQST